MSPQWKQVGRTEFDRLIKRANSKQTYRTETDCVMCQSGNYATVQVFIGNDDNQPIVKTTVDNAHQFSRVEINQAILN